jgi:lysophospholipase L1-like esterase/pimeloyl-ACP methyl ester carboxylesterase
MKLRFTLLFTLLILTGFTVFAKGKKTIKVACIGNSITYGSGIADKPRDAYPAQLARMLGSDYYVRNYGFSGRTMLQKGNSPFMKEERFPEAIKWNPDVVIIMLGTNDSKPKNWKYKDDFEKDYLKMITSFDTLSSHPEIYAVAPVPAFSNGWGISDGVIKNEIYPITKKVAKKKNIHFIDLYTPMLGTGDMFPDGIHPDPEGSGKMAKLIYKELTGKTADLVRQSLPGLKTDWHGFYKYDFDFAMHQAQIIVPEKPLDGNPWVFRARFPNWHYQMDSILLSEGYHIAYVNTNNQFGSPRAVDVWNKFYNYLTEVCGLNKKVSLEGVSRGGLFIYNFAKKYPERINCIYAEAPVCDFTSWPGGFGTGKGSAADWEKLKKEYGFKTDEEAKAYHNNPIDNLEPLAKAKVPVLHMIGLKDSVVPPTENTLVLTDRYIKLGGAATVVPCTLGKQDLWGHHFVIETPRLGADFIKYNTVLPKAKLKSADYHLMRGGLENSFIKFKQNKKARVAFLGGSITYNPGWRDSICNYLENRFPKVEFDFIAAGIPSFGSTEDVFRMERDIFKNGTVDLLFVEAAVNDGGKGRSQKEILRSMEGIVRKARLKDPTTDIVFMYFVDPSKIKEYRAGKVPQVIQLHDKVAEYYDIPALNLAKEVTERIDAGEFTWKDDFKNLHPSPFGQGIYAHSMLEFLDNAWSGFVAEDDKIEVYQPLPKLVEACYDNGVLIPAKEIKPAKGWTFVKNWIPEIKVRTRANFTEVPMLVGEYPAKPIQLEFKGNAVGIAVAAGPDAGIVEYSIDGGAWQKQDLFTKYSKSYHLPWYFTLADGLTPGKHTVKLRIAEDKNQLSVGNRCVLRYFYVNKE